MDYHMVTHVTDDVTVTWPPKVPWGSTVGYPSDSLASCYVTYPTDNYDVSTLSVIISQLFVQSASGKDTKFEFPQFGFN